MIRDPHTTGGIDNYIFSAYKSPISNIIPKKEFTLNEINKLVTSNKYKAVTETLRISTDKAIRSKLKATTLDYVTFSGTFNKRSTNGLKQHSNLFCIDVDDIDNIEIVKENIIKVLPPVFMFTSPSGNGIKVVYKIEIGNDTPHVKYYEAFNSFFKKELNIDIDDKCKDIPRACFLCYDKDAYYNKNSNTLDNSFIDTFIVEPITTPQRDTPQQSEAIPDSIATEKITDYTEIYHNLVKWLNKKETFITGNRNNYVMQLVCACNRYGIPQHETESNLLYFVQDDFTESEIKATIKSIYKNTSYHNTQQFEITKPYDFTPIEEKKEVPNAPTININGFPEYLQSFINEYTDVYNVPSDYIKGSVIFSTALAIGNKMELKTKYDNIPLLWMAIVGNVSSGKTDPLKTCLSYFNERDSIAYKEYKVGLNEFEQYEQLNKKEKETSAPVNKPYYFQYLLNDYTPEALYNAHAINNRGICIYRDELKGWLDDFGRYSKSGEQSTMLSTYYRQPMQINRASKEPINIDKPSIYVSGGIQPDILKDLAKDNRAENGFLSRMMFVYPDVDTKQYYNKKRLNDETLKTYHNYLNAFATITETLNITLSDEAEALYKKWFNDNTDKTNKEPKAYLKGVYGKLDVISFRLAIVVQGMDYVCNHNTSLEITEKSMQTALEWTEYFRATSLKVYNKIFADDTPSLNKTDVAKYCKSLGASQNEIANAIKTSQQYINKILK